ncbi:uncharacterized protein DUF2017 [Roseimicrobium gellanilyticum]|uniref:Uncharacterized protein DUF2017 n=1 Tax=Roseimicrobium gellanilyticum TaxID=748857 RepID=A0A366H8U7_9BACT|nr:DUF2017 family protein [Roseimicrobium gellanilyticum]RBP38534.1 uncharacterized protein DUF2017 [Roseimicrobium gellanilyticum]
MRLTLQKERESWRMSDLDDFHLHLLRQVAEDASVADEAAHKRLFPPPIRAAQNDDDDEFLEDWKDFVADELEQQFAGDVGTVLADLDNVRQHRGIKEGQEPRHLLEIPLDHARAWFSALNQARLMLDQKFNLHPGGENEFRLFVTEEESGGIDVKDRLAVYMRYEFYAAIQEWLVQRAMKLP